MIELRKIYDRLYKQYGPQGWWPAESKFEMMIGAILVQNTNWTNVEKALANLKLHLEPKALGKLSNDTLAKLIIPSGYYNIKARRIKSFLEWFQTYNYDIDKIKKIDRNRLRQELLNINGIGPETADVMLLYAFDKAIFVVDAYARRIFNRLGYDMPKSYDGFRQKVELELPCDLKLYNEFHALIVEHAKVQCRKKPLCGTCPLLDICAQRIESSAKG